MFEDFFKNLDGFDDETLDRFTDALLAFNMVLKADSEKRLETAKARKIK